MTAPTPPVDVVSGWLGAGKTTLLRRFLETGAGGQRVAVVVNELGEIGIDGEVVEGLGFAERMVELSSGCICCQLDTVHFEIALEELCEEIRPDRVVIETTGVADPGALSTRISELGHHLGALVTVADVANLDAVIAEPVGRAQLEAADFLVLSKLDLAHPEDTANARHRLRALNPRAVTIDTPTSETDLALVFSADGIRSLTDPRAGTVPAAGLEAVAWEAGTIERRPVLDALAALPSAVYRAKGVLVLRGASVPLLVDVVAGRLSTQWEPAISGRNRSALVLIGRQAAAWREEVLARFDECRTGADAASTARRPEAAC